MHRKLIVAQLTNSLRLRTAQYVDHMAGPKSLARSEHGRENLLGDLGGVKLLIDRQAYIAPAAAVAVLGFPLLAEISKQESPPAGAEFAVLHHLRQFLCGMPALIVILYLPDEKVLLDLVAERVEKHAFAGLAVAPGAPRLLVVPLDGLGQVVVHHQPDVGLIDAHAERDGGDYDGRLIPDEPVLRCPADRGFESRVVWQRSDTVRREVRGKVFGLFA